MTKVTSKPHIAFTMKSDVVADTMRMLGVAQPAAARGAGGAAWPGRDQWMPHIGALSEWVYGELPEERRRGIEDKLSDVENAFNAALADHHDAAQAEALRRVAGGIRGLEATICGDGSHLTYPYFARWFMLEFAVLNALAERGAASDADQLSAVQMWWRCRDYLQRASRSAYAQRMRQITVAVTGALRNRIFVYDARADAPLTIDVAVGGQDEIELRRVAQSLASAAAADYVRDLRLAEGAEVLARAHSAIVVAQRSRIRQDELVDPLDFWRELEASIEAEVEADRSACGSTLERLLVPGSETLPVLAEARATEVQFTSRAGDKPEYWEQLEAAVPALLGMIPVVGPAVSLVVNAFLQFIGARVFPSRPDPFVEFGMRMEILIFDKIGEYNSNEIRNRLTGFSRLERELVQDYAKHKGKLTPSLQQELKNRGLSLISQITAFQSDVMNPASGSYFRVAPHYMHYFMTYLVAMDLAKTLGIESYDFVGRRKRLYEETNGFVREAIHGIAVERAGQIGIKNTSNGCKADQQHVVDYRRNVTLTDNLALNDMPAGMISNGETACQHAAGIAAGMQIMRGMTREMDGMILRDGVITNNSASGFRPQSIADTFFDAMTYRDSLMRPSYTAYILRGKTHLLAPGGVAEFFSLSKEQRKYAELNPVFPSPNGPLVIRPPS